MTGFAIAGSTLLSVRRAGEHDAGTTNVNRKVAETARESH
jgi:hypothetical protein